MLAHVGISQDVVVAGVVHDAELAVAEGLGDGEGDFGFGFDDAGAHFLGAGSHFLFEGDSCGAANFGVGLSDFFVGFGLFGLEFGTDVVADIDVGDVDGEDFEGGASIDAFAEDEFGDGVWVFEDVFVGVGGADAGDDAFADAGDDSFLGGTADEAFEVGADGDTGADAEGDAIFGDGVNFTTAAHFGMWAVDDFGVDAGADSFDNGFAGAFDGEVDGAGAIEVEGDASFVRSDEGEHDLGDVATGEVVGFELVGEDGDAGFGSGDAGIDEEGVGYAAQPHGDEGGEANGAVGDTGAEPDVKEFADEEEDDKRQNKGDSDEEHFDGCRHGRWGFGLGKGGG